MKINSKALPKHFLYVLSKKDVKEMNRRLENRILAADFSEISFGETHYEKTRAKTPVKHGLVEARPKDGRWLFYLKIKGVRKETIEDAQNEIRDILMKEIMDFILTKAAEPVVITSKPCQYLIGTKKQTHGWISRSSVLTKNLFSTGDWDME